MTANTHEESVEREKPPIEAVPVRHPGRWVGAALVALFGAMFLHSLLTNPNWGWSLIGEWIFSPPILKGVGVTIVLTVLAMIIGLVLGIVLAIEHSRARAAGAPARVAK